MKIAQVSPIFESVPPKGYGGTERVISYLTEELVERGHDITLFASGDSKTRARLVAAVPESIRPDMSRLRQDWLSYHCIEMDQVAELARSFDVIHFHTDFLHFPLARALGTPHVTTLHGRLDFPDVAPLLRRFTDAPLVSISDSQRSSLPWANWAATVHHGLPAGLYRFTPEAKDYFLFIGRVSPEKRLDRAIDIAIRCGTPLYIGAKVDKPDEPYFDDCIRPLLRNSLIRFLGEIGEREKRELLEHAKALLFPIDWPEPFGLVMIEAFSCGTPVIAYPHGAVPEIIEDGINGFVVTNQDEAVAAAERVSTIDRKRCRQTFEQRFTVAHMADNYLRVYQRLLSG
ncbi:MAG TPA: glycosyltransferase family 4 protein [Noviherbaspirillum sp.]